MQVSESHPELMADMTGGGQALLLSDDGVGVSRARELFQTIVNRAGEMNISFQHPEQRNCPEQTRPLPLFSPIPSIF